MSRWKPPSPQSTALITPEGHRDLQSELDRLWKIARPEVVQALAAAAAEGDRSENAEYIYRKKQLGEIDRRVRYLGKRLQALKVVRDTPPPERGVYFGAWLRLETPHGEIENYRIVGPDEIDAAKGWISIDAPLAKALLKKKKGDEISAQLPKGAITYVITAISYSGPIANDDKGAG